MTGFWIIIGSLGWDEPGFLLHESTLDFPCCRQLLSFWRSSLCEKFLFQVLPYLDELTHFGRARVNFDGVRGESRAEGLCVEARFSLVTETHTYRLTHTVCVARGTIFRQPSWSVTIHRDKTVFYFFLNAKCSARFIDCQKMEQFDNVFYFPWQKAGLSTWLFCSASVPDNASLCLWCIPYNVDGFQEEDRLKCQLWRHLESARNGGAWWLTLLFHWSKWHATIRSWHFFSRGTAWGAHCNNDHTLCLSFFSPLRLHKKKSEKMWDIHGDGSIIPRWDEKKLCALLRTARRIIEHPKCRNWSGHQYPIPWPFFLYGSPSIKRPFFSTAVLWYRGVLSLR